MLNRSLALLRPQQWTKNLFIFIPMFFDKHLMDWNYIIPSLLVFFAYSFAASAIYCFNDIWDVEADRLHPKKCMRPIASGDLSIPQGYSIMSVMILLSAFIIYKGFNSDYEKMFKIGAVIFVYFLMNIFYCIKLKQIALIDVFTIAVGFVLRVIIGGVATNIVLSHWIVLMTFLLALFLALSKRRDDILIYMDTGLKTRKNVSLYSLQFINQSITIVAAVTLVCYIMYTVSADVIERMETSNLYLTTFWVLLGIMRYLQLAIVEGTSGSPTKILLHDHFLQFSIVGWLCTFFVIIYL